ncbi:MAG: VOC family protein [Candidatus Obscuribacterales bacterium]|nr:VOC family protein [Steroidobacteraceae bacterium]
MNRFSNRTFVTLALLGLASSSVVAQQREVAKPAATPHIIGAAKLIIGDVKQNQTYYEQMFGMKEVSHFSSAGVYDEPIMGLQEGDARLALFSPLAEKPIKKSQYPVVLIYTAEFDAITKRIEDAKQPLNRLPASQSGTFRIAIARDPSGNAVEILSRPGKTEVGGSKLIVDDRQKAEDFYIRIFGAAAGQRFKTAAYDEVLMQFGQGPFLALFQPLTEAPLPKSRFPVVAIYTTDFDAVLKRVQDAGLGYREIKSSSPDSRIIIAQDPAGNAIEIIRRAPGAPASLAPPAKK